MKTIFLRLVESENKRTDLGASCRVPLTPGNTRLEINLEDFQVLPGSPFAYWAHRALLEIFGRFPPFGSGPRTAKVGLQTSDNYRFARCWWEVPPDGMRRLWFPLSKGGSYSTFYASIDLVVNWARDGVEISNFVKAGTSRVASRPQNTNYFFRPGLSWSPTALGYDRKGLGLSVLPEGSIFNNKSCAMFSTSEVDLTWTLAVFSSSPVDRLIRTLTPSRSWEVGHLMSVPFPDPIELSRSSLSILARRAWSLKRSLDIKTETSHAFVLPALLLIEGNTLAARAQAWVDRVQSVESELAGIQEEIDDLCFELYGIDEADRESITQGFGPGSEDDQEDAVSEDEDITENTTDPTSLVAELVSWCVGVAFGRFDARLATGERVHPDEPEPFDPLPVCSSGMLTGEDGLPLNEAPDGYPLSMPVTGMLVDDPGHQFDLTASVRKVFDVVFGDDADRLWQEASSLLDPKDADIRRWLAKGFFEHHLKGHSKSRRKAPILWQLATPSSSYSVWVYAHKATNDTLFQVLNDFIKPKLLLEERNLTELRDATRDGASASQRKEIAAQEKSVEELRVLKEKVELVSGLWGPNLNDGVVLTLAPLWQLIPHKPWQKELKKAWGSLAAGAYDWSHIAMHLWPERVIPKCASDRSLAIAHGLEDIFWVEQDGKWQRRDVPTEPVEDLVRARSSAGVKACLTGL